MHYAMCMHYYKGYSKCTITFSTLGHVIHEIHARYTCYEKQDPRYKYSHWHHEIHEIDPTFKRLILQYSFNLVYLVYLVGNHKMEFYC